MEMNFYYKSLRPTDLGVFASSNWKGSTTEATGIEIKERLENRRGNKKYIFDFVEDNKVYILRAKWYGGPYSRWKLDITEKE